MLDKLLLFLGIKYLGKSTKTINKTEPIKDLKTVISMKLINNVRNTKESNNKNLNLTNKELCICYFYNFYFFCVNLIFWIQPVYNLVSYINDTELVRHFVSFLLHINIPIIHIWAKIYFKTNHLKSILKCKRFKSFLIISTSLATMAFNVLDIDSFKNEYNFLHYLNEYTFITISCVIWLYSRLMLFLFAYTFIFVLTQHICDLDDIKNNLEKNEFDLENTCGLSAIIEKISDVKFNISRTIKLFNLIISLCTLFGGLSSSLYIREIYSNNTNINDIVFEEYDRYLLFPILVYILSQGVIFFYIFRYSGKRISILQFIKSDVFIKRFLYRLPVKQILSETNMNLNLANLNLTEEISFTLDWLLLGEILSERWLDFTILGISMSDGKLIKKSITIGSILIFSMSFLQNNN